MLAANAPARLVRAHNGILPSARFLAQYDSWLAQAPEDYCDLALGNPQSMPLAGFVDALTKAVTPKDKNWFAYKKNEPYSRDVIQADLRNVTGRHFDPEDIFLTNGATGALMVTLNSLVGAGDEVIYISPHWFFYEGMILNSGGTAVCVKANPESFNLDIDAIERAITMQTRAIIVNSPNNPTGRIYTPEQMKALSALLQASSRKFGRPIHLISDEAYRTIIYDGGEFESPSNFYANSIVIYTYGKTLLTPGQRIGYIALSPEMDELAAMREVISTSQMLCGWAVSSALMQHSLGAIQSLSLDLHHLQEKRDRFVAGLRDCGYKTHTPEGAFYLTPKTPMADDVAFAERLATRGVFCLPGSVVGMPGHLRVSVTASDEMIERALPIFAEENNRCC